MKSGFAATVFFICGAIGSSLLLSPSAHAYQRQYHYYLTYLLADFCGLTDADVIAWADHTTDVYPGCSPGAGPQEWLNPSKITDRRIFHFPVVKRSREVVRDSANARQLLDAAFGESTPDSVFFGLALHPYQDSWSHEGYGPVFGHATHGTRPDLPYLDLPRAIEMAEATWKTLDRWSVRTSGSACKISWSKIAPLIESLSAKRLTNGGALASFWREQIQMLTGQDRTPEDLNPTEHKSHFIKLVAAIKKKFR